MMIEKNEFSLVGVGGQLVILTLVFFCLVHLGLEKSFCPFPVLLFTFHIPSFDLKCI